MALLNNKKQGTGFTNVNRVLQANQGNQLGSTVGTGVSNTARNVQTQTDASKANFEKESQANRLDTKEADEKRENVIGRFNEDNYKVDESNFQTSSGLNEQYQAAKDNYATQQKTQQDAAAKQQATIQARIDADKAAAASLQERQRGATSQLEPIIQGGQIVGYQSRQVGGISSAEKKQLDAYNASVNSLTGLQGIQGGVTEAQGKELEAQLADIESQYGEMTAKEKAAWINTEKEKLIQQNMLTDQEINDFTKYRAGVYTGPKELNDYATLSGQAAEAGKLGDLTGSSGGRQELLRRFVGGDGYTQGQQRLDTMLLGQDGSALQQARKDTRGVENQVKGANENASNLAQEYTGRAKIFGDETTKQLNDARNPLSTKIDEQLGSLTADEKARNDNFTKLQDVLSGKAENMQGMDRMTQLGVGLQSAMDNGYLTQEQANQLLGDNGLISRAEALGLNANDLINQRITNTAASNMNRGGAASSTQEAQLTALDKLLGKQGQDVEFGTAGEDVKKGKTGFDTESLDAYLKQVEDGKAKTDTKYAESIKKMREDQSAMGGLNMIKDGTMQNLTYDPRALVGGTANIANGAAQSFVKAPNDILKAMNNMKINGVSVADMPGGSQLNQLIAMQDKLGNAVLDPTKTISNSLVGGTQDIFKGNVAAGLKQLLGGPGNVLKDTTKNIGNEIGNAVSKVASGFGAGSTGNWDVGDYNMTSATGQKMKVKDFAKMSSGDILNQLLSEQQINSTNSVGKSSQGKAGARTTDRLIQYYQQALAREGK